MQDFLKIMELEHCIYEKEAKDKEVEIDLEKRCLLKIFINQKNIKAGRGICERCKSRVRIGQFDYISSGSLTDID